MADTTYSVSPVDTVITARSNIITLSVSLAKEWTVSVRTWAFWERPANEANSVGSASANCNCEDPEAS